MDRTVTATHAKAHLLALLDQAEAGEEIEITKHGRVVARLVGAAGPVRARGSLVGLAATAGGDDGLFRTNGSWNAS